MRYSVIAKKNKLVCGKILVCDEVVGLLGSERGVYEISVF